MTYRTIVLDALGPRWVAAALVVDGRLKDLLIDPNDARPPTGAIRRARVDRLIPKMGAAFVKLEGGETGYLRDAKGLREGEKLLVQVTAQAEQQKALPVSRRLLYKGRRIIHTPDAPGINVSRRIGNAVERERLSGIVAGWLAPDEELAQMHEQGGFILRTAARNAGAKALEAEIALLLPERRSREAGAVAPMHSAALCHALREWTAETPHALLMTSRAEAMVRDIFRWRGAADADLAEVVRVHGGPDPFGDLGLEEQIDALHDARVALPCGGHISVEPTKALVAVDVNTGERFGPGAALTANLEAAREIPRQLRLRGLGGQVVVDFAPVPKRDRKRVEDALKAALRDDPIETSVAGWSPLGLCELSRKRERRPLAETIHARFSDVFTRT